MYYHTLPLFVTANPALETLKAFMHHHVMLGQTNPPSHWSQHFAANKVLFIEVIDKIIGALSGRGQHHDNLCVQAKYIINVIELHRLCYRFVRMSINSKCKFQCVSLPEDKYRIINKYLRCLAIAHTSFDSMGNHL